MEKSFALRAKIVPCISSARIVEEIAPSEGDLVVADGRGLKLFPDGTFGKCKVLMREDLPKGPLTARTADSAAALAGAAYSRVIGIGGGLLMQLAKILATERPAPCRALWEDPSSIRRDRGLVLVPTTPGTGTEATPFASVFFPDEGAVRTIESPELEADLACLCPEALSTLPFERLAASSFEAFTHACESYISPCSTFVSRALCEKSLRTMVLVWKKVARTGAGALSSYLGELQEAGCLAGAAVGCTGPAAVQALAAPLMLRLGMKRGAAYYALLGSVLEKYDQKSHSHALEDLKALLGELLKCDPEGAFGAASKLCSDVMPMSPLGASGMKEEQIPEFTDIAVTRGALAISNSYSPLTAGEVRSIYSKLL
ncbi:MAG: iron-containing alcohol dehydrogenase [Succinivibrio sp.]